MENNSARRNLLRMIQSLPESTIPVDITVSLVFTLQQSSQHLFHVMKPLFKYFMFINLSSLFLFPHMCRKQEWCFFDSESHVCLFIKVISFQRNTTTCNWLKAIGLSDYERNFNSREEKTVGDLVDLKPSETYIKENFDIQKKGIIFAF